MRAMREFMPRPPPPPGGVDLTYSTVVRREFNKEECVRLVVITPYWVTHVSHCKDYT
jgi:hypothetical protein